MAQINPVAPALKLKKYSGEITVTVDIQKIANMLLAIYASFPNAVGLTETVIDMAKHNNTLGFIYNSLCGFSNNLEGIFVGHTMYSSQTIGKTVHEDGDYFTRPMPIGKVTILEINVYRGSNDDVYIEYEDINRNNGETIKDRAWIGHGSLSSDNPNAVIL